MNDVNKEVGFNMRGIGEKQGMSWKKATIVSGAVGGWTALFRQVAKLTFDSGGPIRQKSEQTVLLHEYMRASIGGQSFPIAQRGVDGVGSGR